MRAGTIRLGKKKLTTPDGRAKALAKRGGVMPITSVRGKFESHLTFHISHADAVRAAADEIWRFSRFDADPIMGDKPHCYLTAYDTDPKVLGASALAKVVALKEAGVPALRAKIERIVYDTRTGIDEVGLDPGMQ